MRGIQTDWKPERNDSRMGISKRPHDTETKFHIKDLYYNVFKRISNQLRQMNALDLNYISPLLAKAYNFEISVPGTYDPSAPLVTIVSVNSHMQVIMSKQRPRKIKMRGYFSLIVAQKSNQLLTKDFRK